MRRNRVLWGIMWLLSVVLISFFGGVISYGLFAVLTIVPIISLVYLSLIYILFHVYQKIDRRFVTVNETVPFMFSLVNDYFLIFAGIRVRFFTSFSTINGLSDEIEYELLPKSGINKETNLICHYRGEYEVGIKNIEIQDYFRLFRFSYRNRETITAIVKPRIIMLEHIGKLDIENAIKDSQRNKSVPDVLTREYIFGDDPRMINWNQSAASGSLMTRIRKGQENQNISIIMETCRYTADQLTYIPLENKILETTLAISNYLSRKHISAKEYHYSLGLRKHLVGEDRLFMNYYNCLSEVIFDKENTRQKLFEAVIGNKEVFESSMAFLVVTEYCEYIKELVNVFSFNDVYTVVYIVSDKPDCILDTPKGKGFELHQIPTESELMEVMR